MVLETRWEKATQKWLEIFTYYCNEGCLTSYYFLRPQSRFFRFCIFFIASTLLLLLLILYIIYIYIMVVATMTNSGRFSLSLLLYECPRWTRLQVMMASAGNAPPNRTDPRSMWRVNTTSGCVPSPDTGRYSVAPYTVTATNSRKDWFIWLHWKIVDTRKIHHRRMAMVTSMMASSGLWEHCLSSLWQRRRAASVNRITLPHRNYFYRQKKWSSLIGSRHEGKRERYERSFLHRER